MNPTPAITTAVKRFTRNEELANSISHAIGLILAVVGTIFILKNSIQNGNHWVIISNAVFGVTMILLYFSSTLNHSLKAGKTKEFFHNFDQVAIYLLIAGTYTPLSLIAIRNDWGWLMFGIQWSFALAGILIKFFKPNQFEHGVRVFTIVSYILMGWLFLFFIIPIINNMNSISLMLILAGGIFYSSGVIFFKIKNLSYAHLIWHLMVIAGTACHYTAILLL